MLTPFFSKIFGVDNAASLDRSPNTDNPLRSHFTPHIDVRAYFIVEYRLTLWAFGNISKFGRHGETRIGYAKIGF